MIQKLLLYGGAFNPPHLGHERLLKGAIEAVRPDLTLVAPSEVSPHKEGAPVPFFDRAYMCRTFLDCGGDIRISGMENSGARRKSYTINTVQRLRKKYPKAEIYLLIGSDMLRSFDTWRQYRRLLSMVTLVAAGRGDSSPKQLLDAKTAIEKSGGRVLLLGLEPLVVSSTEIREKLKQGQDTAGLLSDFVARYAAKRKLYQ